MVRTQELCQETHVFEKECKETMPTVSIIMRIKMISLMFPPQAITRRKISLLCNTSKYYYNSLSVYKNISSDYHLRQW